MKDHFGLKLLVAAVMGLSLLITVVSGSGFDGFLTTLPIVALITASGAGAARLYSGGLYTVPPDMIGIVHLKHGRYRPEDVHDVRFQGSPGVQAGTLASGRVHWRLPFVSRIECVPLVRIRPGHVGLVTAKVGANLSTTVPLARHVECDHFQDGAAFLRNGGQQGPQPALLAGGGYYAINPYMFTVEELPQARIAAGMVGLVMARVGANLPASRPVARHVECDHFQDAARFLQEGGEQGPQPMLLAGGGYYNINPYVFTVEEVPQTYIRPGKIGVVVARVGENLPFGRPFGRHVECDSFQDGAAFLRNGGQQGAQLALLTGGNRYNINPHMFEVITEDNVEEKGTGLTREDLALVELYEGNTGVVVVREGAPAPEGTDLAPRVPGHDRFQLPWIFLERGGQQGTQAETLPGGADYAVNPLFARVVRIPTRELILEWDDKGDRDGDRYDSALEPIKATIEGHTVRVHLTQSLRIPPVAAPILVKRFGEQENEDADQFGFVNKRPAPVKRFVERILGSVVSAHFSNISAQYKIADFVDNQHQVQADLQAEIQLKMEEWDVVASNTTLVQIMFEDGIFNKTRQKLVASRVEYSLLEQKERNNEVKQRIRERTLETRRKRLTIEAGAELQVLIGLLGKDQVLKERFIRLLAQFDVPQVIAGGGDVSELADFISPSVLMDVLNKVMNEPRGTVVSSRLDSVPPPHPDSTRIDVESWEEPPLTAPDD